MKDLLSDLVCGLGFFRDDPRRLTAAIAYLAAPPLGEK